MKSNESIEELIEKLSRLQTEQTATIKKIAELRQEEAASYTQDISLDTVSCQVDADTGREGQRIVDRTPPYKRHQADTEQWNSVSYYWRPAPHNSAPQDVFKQGTRVYITNSITPKVRGVKDERDRRATVIAIRYHGGNTRIHITTDNAVNTYRYPRYLGLPFIDDKVRANNDSTRYQDQYD